MKPTKFQQHVQELIRGEDKPSLLLVAPTGLGKTFAVTADIQDRFTKTVYGVPLRALGNDIRCSIERYCRDGENVKAVVHHGGAQESDLFGEEVIVTTYDQIVCGVPGLPLSLPLKAGHAVAGALLMSRLILDEAHLAWTISDSALSILLAIVQFRARYGLQTIVQTATLPDAVSKLLADELGLKRVLVGTDGEVNDDEALALRDKNRIVQPHLLLLEKIKGEKVFNYGPVDSLLTEAGDHNRIYFANTVDRIQNTYDRLIDSGVSPDRILVLHNRMPHKQRAEVESNVRASFGEAAQDNDLILLTNQVAEAGLNISAPLVISDPAPVDTLVQRAGRAARWFRSSNAEGRFYVIDIPSLAGKTPTPEAKDYAKPYLARLVSPAISYFPEKPLTWETEREWVNKAWGGGEKEALKQVKKSLNETTFALNLFDRAAQERQPGQIANAFREILSVEVALEEGNHVALFVDDISTSRDIQAMLDAGERPDTSSISLGKAMMLVRDAGGNAAVIRYEDGDLNLRSADNVQVSDILVLPSTMAYLHPVKGLCFGDGSEVEDANLESCWSLPNNNAKLHHQNEGHRQSLAEHTQNVMAGAYSKLTNERSPYYTALSRVLSALEKPADVEQMARLLAQITCVAVAFHDLGKAGIKWQKRIREIDPSCPPGLVGRSRNTGQRIGVPHTPPGYTATMEACRLLFGENLGNAKSLVRAITLAASRHHSSLFNPATVKNYSFTPHPDAIGFIENMLREVGASPSVIEQADKILEAARKLPDAAEVPLMLPNHDLFAIYALIGRAILIADREDAAGKPLEETP